MLGIGKGILKKCTPNGVVHWHFINFGGITYKQNSSNQNEFILFDRLFIIKSIYFLDLYLHWIY